MNIKRATWLALSVLLAVGVLAAATSWTENRSASQRIVSAIEAHLQAPGDWVMVSDIYAGEWTKVCLVQSMSTYGTQNEARIKAKFGITGPVNLPYGIASGTDSAWGLMFFYPPNTVEAVEISNRALLELGVDGAGPDEQIPICRIKRQAVFKFKDAPRGKYALVIQMTTVERLEDRET